VWNTSPYRPDLWTYLLVFKRLNLILKAHGLSADATSELLAVAVNSTPCAAAVDSGYDPAL